MTDYLLWKNDIENRFSPTPLTDALTGSIYIATAIISSVTTKSGEHTSQWDAYKDLRERLLNGDDKLLPHSTTTQRDALSGIVAGTVIDNITIGRLEKYNGTAWINVSRRSNAISITASTTQTQGQQVLSADLNIISTVANNNDVVTLPTAEQGIGVIVVNNGTKKLQVFPSTGDDIGEGVNTSISLLTGSIIVFHCYDTTNWVFV